MTTHLLWIALFLALPAVAQKSSPHYTLAFHMIRASDSELVLRPQKKDASGDWQLRTCPTAQSEQTQQDKSSQGDANMILAKIADPPPLTQGNVSFASHFNYVEATDIRTGKLLWKTTLFPSGYTKEYDPALEQDVQWNIINRLHLDADVIVAQNSKGEEFRIDSKTGQVISL
jgi:hypothetical protein